ncbi:MAG: glutamine synthetase [Chloroflexi bacterium]|nr:glutamine synthetase [Chloroflexota bacterium]MXX49235.1 glutamine synthetase [Chloroflexota bacterium]MYC01370.1 glutamine synthetase [Chloroflexota bacterium]MYD52915.1 glutamine synthetase [Chloroflexota bacterium]MYJ57554.1 glutamine synthetase [Chloroflexota bacterium]
MTSLNGDLNAPPSEHQHVLNACREHDVRFVRLWFTDLLGQLKSVAITIDELPAALEKGVEFDGASIEGFARHDESDMVALPDPDTFVVLPWRPQQHRVARMICDIHRRNGDPFEGDPRRVLRRQLESAQQRGYTFYVAPQIEYFYFRAPDDPSPLDSGGYFDLSPLDTATDLRRETVLTLEEMGIGVESSHHEAAPSQHEIDLRYTDALTMADQVMTTRLVVKEVAIKQGVHATFMPKPLNGVNGSGMHVYLSLFDHEQNLFYAEGGGLSEIARSFLAGLLAFTPQFTLITNQWSNSYKRLAPGTEAPVYLTWSHANQSDLVRIPEYEPGDSESTRLEYRGADSATNPYLAFSAFLAAGLRGIDEGLVPPPAAEDNVFELTPAERAAREIIEMPTTQGRAIEAFSKSDLMKSVLGEYVWSTVLQNKRLEWDEYRSQVTDYELNRYLAVL